MCHSGFLWTLCHFRLLINVGGVSLTCGPTARKFHTILHDMGHNIRIKGIF